MKNVKHKLLQLRSGHFLWIVSIERCDSRDHGVRA